MEIRIVGLTHHGSPTTVGKYEVSPQPTKSLNIVRQTWRVCIEQEHFPSAGRPPGGQLFLEEI